MSPLGILIVFLGVHTAQGWWIFSNKKKEEDNKICAATPQDDSDLQVEYTLYTTENPDNGDNLTPDADSLRQSKFKADRDTKFLIHGYTDQGSSDWVKNMAKEFLKHEDLNVVAVNWQKGADSLYYGQSAANTRRVGEMVGDFIRQLKEVMGAPYSSQHLIGHSLGAHISGFAGASLNGQVARITGLDPAGPCFRFSGPDDRLSDDDAIFVDAIHTDGDLLLQGGFGTELPMGDADFYPNGGEKQPGCDSWIWQHLVDLFTKWIDGFTSSLACNHLRVLDLFRESIDPANSFKAYPCDSYDDYNDCRTCRSRGCSRMGYHASPMKHGIYTLRTHSKSPYSYDY
ncbi:pancreatic triacylglycerol lipase-like [Liolophura sinensis]|uniref:pancreatic triacylglycerol lipase-like n=1 Tax=Liolophura sinensis TaxID=3198878 RepID=UPI0031591C0D